MTPAIVAAFLLGSGAVVEDLRRRTIPNWLSIAGFSSGIGCAVWSAGWHGLGRSVAGTVVGFAVFALFYRRGGLGGGDLKLMAAFGALLGPAGILLAALFAAIGGAVLAVVWLLWKPRTAAIPYAPAIVLGAWLALLGG